MGGEISYKSCTAEVLPYLIYLVFIQPTYLLPSLRFKGLEIKLTNSTFDINTKADFDLADFGAKFTTKADQSRVEVAENINVFISYAWANKVVVDAIDTWLCQKNLQVRLDERDFFARTRIREEILRIMESSEIILIIYSKESKDRAWTEFERELAGDLQIEAKKEGKSPPRVIYVVIDGTPLPNVTEKSKIAIMANEQRIRQPGGGRKRVVETMDGLSEAFLRIIEHNTAGSPVDAS